MRQNIGKNFLLNKAVVPIAMHFATVFNFLFAKATISERLSATVKPELQTTHLDRPNSIVLLIQPKPVCATIYLENATEPAISLYQGELVNRTEFDSIRVDKLKNARFSIGKDQDDFKYCRMEVCGFSESKDEWGNCEYFRGNVTAPDDVFGNDYEVTSVSCSCNPVCCKDNCHLSECIEKFKLHRWKTSECAVLYQETGCQACYFLPITIHNNTNFNTSNSYQIHSAIVRPDCLLRKTYTGFHWWDDYPGDMNFTNIADNNLPVFHKDSENFYCLCPPSNDSSTTTQSATLSTLEESTSFTISPVTPENSKNKNTKIIIISVAVSFTALVCIGLFLVYTKRNTKYPKPRSNSGNISIIDKWEDQSDFPDNNEPRLSSIADGIQNFAKHFVISDHFQTNLCNQTFQKDQTAECSQANYRIEHIAKRFINVCHTDHIISRNAFTIVDLENPLGSGEFGIVYKGLLHKENNLSERVAVKKIKWKETHETIVESFVRELNIFQNVGTEHKHIVGFVGACCHSDGLYLLTEYCDGGSLRQTLLTEYRPKYQQLNTYSIGTSDATKNLQGSSYLVMEQNILDHDDLYQLLFWCEQIASGMEFLSSKRIIHVDLAARNILLTSDMTIKICDLGLSRKCLGDVSCAKSLIVGQFPFHSYAPELISDGNSGPVQVTLYVDIWAYGCTLWELFTLGSSLYPSVTDEGFERIIKIRELILQGYRHPKPDLAPQFVYDKLLECWNEIPRDRPSFRDLHDFFRNKCNELKS